VEPGAWKQFADYENLLAIGVTLVMAGVVLGGLATGIRRELARRRQHRRDVRRPGEGDPNEPLDRPPTWWERNAGAIAKTTLFAGLAITALAFLRR
jgi:hypothetical protein